MKSKTRLENGMISTGSLNAEGIALILKACSEQGVSRLKLQANSLEIEFATKVSSYSKLEPQVDPPIKIDHESKIEWAPGLGPTKNPPQETPVEFELSQVDKNLMEEAARSQLLIDDPGSFEDLMIDEHLHKAELRTNHDSRNEDRGTK